MPAISLVVCLHRERDLFERLLKEMASLYDDLVVLHDGPENDTGKLQGPIEIAIKPPAIDYANLTPDSPMPEGYTVQLDPAQPRSIHELVHQQRGRYFEGPRCFQQEPHWPFAWSRAKYDWLLRLDADEFPSAELKEWLGNFRAKVDVDPSVSGYTCIWPVWNGARTVTQHWPAGRNFLFHRKRVRFLGVAEQVPIADHRYESLSLILCHRPCRKSHGIANVLRRRQGGFWRTVIAQSLINQPQNLPRWRWDNEEWPERWAEVRRHPLRTACTRLIFDSLRTFRDQWKAEKRVFPGIGISGPMHHALFCFQFWRLRRSLFQRNKKNGS